ncbi:hypothetical protein D3C78_1062100 [compost metagenome]
MPHILPLARPEQCGGLRPLILQRIERRIEQQQSERDLEVGVDEDKARTRVEVESVDQPPGFQQQGNGTVDAEHDDEGERQRHPAEVAGHGDKGQQHPFDPLATVAQRGGPEGADGKPRQTGDTGDTQRVAEGLHVEGGA